MICTPAQRAQVERHGRFRDLASDRGASEHGSVRGIEAASSRTAAQCLQLRAHNLRRRIRESLPCPTPAPSTRSPSASFSIHSRISRKANLSDEKLLELDEKDIFPEELVRAIGSEELGVQLVFIPEEFGGMGGGAFDVYRVCEAMARIDVGLATGVLATFLGSDPIVFGGTPEQREHWLSRIAEEGLLMAYGATEPARRQRPCGTQDSRSTRRKGRQVVGYEITGNKQWISNGGHADVYTVLAKAPGGPTWFVVERGAEGFSSGKPEDKHGIRLSNTTALILENVYVDADRLVGLEEGQGLRQAQLVFGFTRLMVAAFGLGAGWAALDRTIEYSMERIQAGAPLSEKQGYTHKLIVPHAVRLEAARAYIEQTAESIDKGGETPEHGGRDREVPRDRGGQRSGGRGDSGPRRIRVHQRVHGREDQARRSHHHDLRGDLGDHGDDDRRDRWQHHLKTRGQHYHDLGRRLEGVHSEHPKLAPTSPPWRPMRWRRSWSGRAPSVSRATSTSSFESASSPPTSRAPRRSRACGPHRARVTLTRSHRGDSTPGPSRRWHGSSPVRPLSAWRSTACAGLSARSPADADAQSLETSAGLSEIYAAQAGLIDDMNQVGMRFTSAPSHEGAHRCGTRYIER